MKRKTIVGDNMRRLREKSGLTQEELALKSGLSQGYINQLESGKRRYTQKSLELIAGALSVPVIELFRGEETQHATRVSEKTGRYEGKRSSRKELLSLLKELPDHVVEHYLTLLKLEKEMRKKRR
ncbi:MAG TPA: helix-turn-helix transcriptional regulator [Thermodesulfovibrionales bacterium]|nr:helix-turn-helix transcriptional regulator [Thermodesulfovibrionales bacterium]